MIDNKENRSAFLPVRDFSKEVRLQVPSHPYHMRMIRYCVGEFARLEGFSLQEIKKMKVVVGELVSNILEHAYENRRDMPILCRIISNEKKLMIYLRDFGKQVDLSLFKPRPLQDYQERGLGLYLVQKLSDFVRYNRTSKIGTEVEVHFLKS